MPETIRDLYVGRRDQVICQQCQRPVTNLTPNYQTLKGDPVCSYTCLTGWMASEPLPTPLESTRKAIRDDLLRNAALRARKSWSKWGKRPRG